MAIEIGEKAKVKKISLIDILLYLCVILLAIFALSYFILTGWQKKLETELVGIDESLKKTSEEESVEKEVLGWRQKIEDFGDLLAKHQTALNIFGFLEKAAHPQVWFKKMDLDLPKKTLILSGQAANFEVLGQQILIFREQESVESLDLSRVSMDKEGGVQFDVQIVLKVKIFAPETESSG